MTSTIRTCANCHGPHTTWQCPEVRALLFAPALFACNSCGDPIDHDGICAACREYDGADYRTEIVYTRETHEYAMYVNGELTGFARTYHEADLTLNELISELRKPLAA